MARGRPPSTSTRLLSRVSAEVRKYIRGKKGLGGYSLEGLTSFLQLTRDDPITWGVASAADELFTTLWRTAWREVHEQEGTEARTAARTEMLDHLAAFADLHLRGRKKRQTLELLERARKVVASDLGWNLRSTPDKTALTELCAIAEIEEVGAELEDDDGQLMLFTFGGGKKIDRIIAFPDASVPGKSRSVYSRFCTIRQYELHVGMKRANADRAGGAAKVEEDKLAWLLDRAGGDRTTVIFDLRDGVSPTPPFGPRPTA